MGPKTIQIQNGITIATVSLRLRDHIEFCHWLTYGFRVNYKVNGRYVNEDYVLQEGDMLEGYATNYPQAP
jgi:hypothetical protein